jgi:subtilisin family serine protease
MLVLAVVLGIAPILMTAAFAAEVNSPAAGFRQYAVPNVSAPLAFSSDQTVAAKVADLRAKAQQQGAVRVIVGLKVPFAPEGLLAASDVSQQRGEIAAAQQSLGAQIMALGGEVHARYKTIPFMAVKVNEAGLDDLVSSPDVISIEEDTLNKPTLYQSVPLIGGDTAWAMGYTGAGQAVAILDTGVDKTHPFLTGKVVSEACYSTNDATSLSSSLCPGGVTDSTATGSGVNCDISGCYHGTHVAGIAAGKNGSYSGYNFSGVAKDASIIAIQVFSNINGSLSSWISDEIKGLEQVYALRNTYQIAAVNLSLGGGCYTSNCDTSDPAFKTATDNLRSVGIATVIASGNNGCTNGISHPACISTAISVGATDKSDVVASYSNSANFLDLLAPGSSILSSIPGGGYAYLDGTSMATPHVTGAWAILKSAKPTATVDEILTALRNTGKPITDTRNGLIFPRISVANAVQSLILTNLTNLYIAGVGDFNGDGKSDILWRNTSTGQVTMWLMNGTSMSTSATLATDPAWTVAGVGDFNGDGKSDILWRNTSTGQVTMWLMNGATMTSWASIIGSGNTAWTVAGVGDFNGDGKSDILWRNTSTGQVTMWLMNGATMTSWASIIDAGNQAWTVAGTGDFNGDGKADILWRNSSTGQVTMWLMNGATMTSWASIIDAGNQAWTVAGTGRFDSDLNFDVLWRNSSTGMVTLWFMNGTNMKSWGVVAQ